MPTVEARGLVKIYGEGRAARRLLDGADLVVEAGEVVAILGLRPVADALLRHLNRDHGRVRARDRVRAFRRRGRPAGRDRARFDPEGLQTLDERVRALPNLAARSYRFERNNVTLAANGRHTHRGAMHVILGGRRGYLVAESRDLSGRPDEVVVEQGLAREWQPARRPWSRSRACCSASRSS